MPAGASRAGAVAVLLAGLLPAWPARAQPAAHDADVEVTVVGAGAEADPLVDTIRDLLGRLTLTLAPHVAASAADAPSSPSARVVVDLDFTTPGEVGVTVRGDATHAAARQRIVRDGSASVVREEVGEAVSSMVAARLLADAKRDAGPPPPEPQEAPPPPPPPPAPLPEPPRAETVTTQPARDRPFAVDLTTFAGAGPLAGNVGIAGRLGGGVVFASRRGLHPSLLVEGAGVLPFGSSTDGVTVRTTLESFRAIGAIQAVRSYSWLAVDVGAGFGFDVLSVDPTTPPTAATTNPTTYTDPVACALVAANFALTPGVVLTIAVAGDVDLTPRNYVVAQGPAAATATTGDSVFAPWPVRPTALAGFTFTAFGDGRFAAREPQ
jgi:hypothetical protein